MSAGDWRPFEETEHTADLALVARGRDFRELILNVSRGVLHLIAEAADLDAERWVPIESSGSEPERLLLGFVNQVLFEWETHSGLPVAVEVEAAPDMAWLARPAAEGEVRGRLGIAHPADLEERIKALPKAATYHDLRIERTGRLLEVGLVLDT
jgi:SHS2 domain-containing protein